MKITFYIFSLLFAFSLKINAQNKIVIQNNNGTFLNQSVQFDPAQDKYYLTAECKLGAKYAPQELILIKSKLISDFGGARLVQSTTENKIIFITNKRAVVGNQGIEEYLKNLLVNINLYRGFEGIIVGTLELK
ncbi:MAG: hypothetical protein IPG89_04805 [Bacteroidetes bacterium]|nr:hypothetical protein [Bacteroidota bacterium]